MENHIGELIFSSYEIDICDICVVHILSHYLQQTDQLNIQFVHCDTKAI